jgi:SAM-dependent methyltransferase
MQDYYNRRAGEYELIYSTDDQDRQAELAAIESQIVGRLAGKRVLEIACGTGYWTAIAARSARHVTAVDSSEEMLAVARSKQLPRERVTLLKGDAYALEGIPGEFDAALANFWLSHVPRARIATFLTGLHAGLTPAALVFLADNVHVSGVGGELIEPEGSPDTFKLRTLSDGSQHLIIKNYYDEKQLRKILAPVALNLEIRIGRAYWWCVYEARC